MTPEWAGSSPRGWGGRSARCGSSGGASKEAWAVDAHGDALLVRRAGVGVIYEQTLSLAHEFAVLEAAYEAGVRVRVRWRISATSAVERRSRWSA